MTVDHSDIERAQLQKLQAGFHACTGCDLTPWKGILLECFAAALGYAEVTERRWSSWDAELFICKIQCENSWSVMSHRAHNLCQKFCPQQMMHPLFTSNRPTVRQQFGNNVICSTHNPLPPETMGWRLEDSVFVSVLKSLPSGLDACADLIFCACTKHCTRISCKCRMSCTPCTATCKCHDTGNIHDNGWRMMKCSIHWRY